MLHTVWFCCYMFSFPRNTCNRHPIDHPSRQAMGCLFVFNFNSMWPSDAIWWHRSGSTLAQVMACCLMAPSHYLNQWWLIISEVQWHSYQGNFTRDASTINHWNLFENYMSKITVKFPRGQWVKVWSMFYFCNCSDVWDIMLCRIFWAILWDFANLWTHWPLRDFAVILNGQFWNTF